jgi:signal transduction histidine kinase
VLFVGITAVSVTALGWLGWKLVQQDQALARTRAYERRENAVGLAVSELQKQLAQVETALTELANLPESEFRSHAANYGRRLAADAVLIVFNGKGVQAIPAQRLLYYPVSMDAAEQPPAEAFAEADALERAKRDVAAAIAVLEKLSRSPDMSIRAGALVRLGRNFRKAHRWGDAESVYEQLARAEGVTIDGLPAELVARDALAAVYEEQGDGTRLHTATSALCADLHNGRWALARPDYDHFEGRARQWFGVGAPAPGRDAEALASAVASLSDEWHAGQASNRRRSTSQQGRSVLLVERTSPARTVALAATANFIESSWLSGLARLAASHGARVALIDDTHLVTGPIAGTNSRQQYPGVSTGLPWTLSIVPVDTATAPDELALRRRLVLAGVVSIVLLVVSGSYLIGRAVTRELAVARLQSDFVAAVSHEFRTPLTALRQLSEMLAAGRVPNDNVRQQYYKVLEHESSRLHRLVEGLLKFGRMEAGAARYQFERIDVAVFMRSLLAEFAAEADRRGCRVELNAEAALPPTRADREALGCVVWNLLDNAVKYSQDCRTVWVNLACESGRVAISVRDHGVGIRPEERRRIFEKFVRGGAAQTLGVQGTGIGLAVSRQIVVRHGGEIRLETEPGHGSTFTVLLPATEVGSA